MCSGWILKRRARLITAWKFAFASRSPIHCMLSPLARLDNPFFVRPHGDNEWRDPMTRYVHEFAIDYIQNHGSDTLPHVPLENVQAITHLTFGRAGVLVSNAQAVPLQTYFDSLPAVSGRGQGRGESKRDGGSRNSRAKQGGGCS
jgi:hypothetical protein